MTDSGRLGYRPELDGLRGVAVAIVLALHWWPHDFPGGRIGVDLFFVLSGFLITAIMLEEADRFSLARFYERRARRLLPALAVLVLIFCWADGIHWVALYVGNWARAAGELHPYLGHTWSLAIEEQFYIVWPFVFLALRTCRRWVSAGALIGLALASGWHRSVMDGITADRLINGSDTRLDGLALGCALAFAWPYLRNLRVGALAVAALPALGYVVLFDAQLHRWGYTLVSAAWTLVLLAVLNGSGHRILSVGPMVWLGALSYSLYLWHFPISAWVRGGSLYNTSAPTTVLAIGLSLLAAMASYRFVETPFRRRSAGEAAGGGLGSDDVSGRPLGDAVEQGRAGLVDRLER